MSILLVNKYPHFAAASTADSQQSAAGDDQRIAKLVLEVLDHAANVVSVALHLLHGAVAGALCSIEWRPIAYYRGGFHPGQHVRLGETLLSPQFLREGSQHTP